MPSLRFRESAGFSDDKSTMAAVLLALITTASGLIGVVLGGWLTSRNQKRERQIRFFHEPGLANSDGSLLAMHCAEGACESGAAVEN